MTKRTPRVLPFIQGGAALVQAVCAVIIASLAVFGLQKINPIIVNQLKEIKRAEQMEVRPAPIASYERNRINNSQYADYFDGMASWWTNWMENAGQLSRAARSDTTFVQRLSIQSEALTSGKYIINVTEQKDGGARLYTFLGAGGGRVADFLLVSLSEARLSHDEEANRILKEILAQSLRRELTLGKVNLPTSKASDSKAFLAAIDQFSRLDSPAHENLRDIEALIRSIESFVAVRHSNLLKGTSN